MARLATNAFDFNALATFLGGRRQRRIGYQTWVRHLPDSGFMAIRYHATDIAVVDDGDGVTLDNGGYYTRTTLDRINAIVTSLTNRTWCISAHGGRWKVTSRRSGMSWVFQPGQARFTHQGLMMNADRTAPPRWVDEPSEPKLVRPYKKLTATTYAGLWRVLQMEDAGWGPSTWTLIGDHTWGLKCGGGRIRIRYGRNHTDSRDFLSLTLYPEGRVIAVGTGTDMRTFTASQKLAFIRRIAAVLGSGWQVWTTGPNLIQLNYRGEPMYSGSAFNFQVTIPTPQMARRVGAEIARAAEDIMQMPFRVGDGITAAVLARREMIERAWALHEIHHTRDLETVNNIYAQNSVDEIASRLRDIVERQTGDRVDLCTRCDRFYWWEDLTERDDQQWCGDCYAEVFTACDRCGGEIRREDTSCHDDTVYCGVCWDEVIRYCAQCEEHYHVDDEEAHEHPGPLPPCRCEADEQVFVFPANGHGLIHNDEQITVELPRGTIDAYGLRQTEQIIEQLLLPLYPGLYSMVLNDANLAMNALGDQWQTSGGNFTKRFARYMWKTHKIKVPDETISHIGNLAREHSDKEARSLIVSLTRDFNQPAAEFGNDGSCWWGGYSEGLCALKGCGGLGLRTFDEEGDVSGRAWIMPLNSHLLPTRKTEAHAYIAFNGYGNLDGWIGARVLAQMTQRTYRRVKFSCSPMYVNSLSGYLIASADVCAATTEINLSLPIHGYKEEAA